MSLRVASCPAIARFLLVPALPLLRARAPHVDLELAMTTEEEQSTWSTHYDAVVWYGFRPNLPSRAQVLWAGNSVSYASPWVRLRSDLPQICWSAGEVAATTRGAGRQLVACDLAVALEMAAGGAGFVACPAEIGAAYVDAGRLVPVSASVADPRALYLIRGSEGESKSSQELTQWLMHSLKAACRSS
ncbi:LysR substrate-binding domain-containing protein [Streptococcus pyogenes]|uniref:LysR substrate-binding domain-containing protein n=1 Tax=Streptococcus pyogenes TaxID=1314 RepID=UPI003DA18951